MYALLDKDRTPIHESALCGQCVEDPQAERAVRRWVMFDETWDGDPSFAVLYETAAEMGLSCVQCGSLALPDEVS